MATHLHVNMFNARALRALAAAEGFHLQALTTDDAVDLLAADWLVEHLPRRLPERLPEQVPWLAMAAATAAETATAAAAAPAFALDQVVRRLARKTGLPSRLGMGAHLEAVFVKPLPDDSSFPVEAEKESI